MPRGGDEYTNLCLSTCCSFYSCIPNFPSPFSLPSLCSLYPHYPRSIILWSFQVTSTMPPIPNAGAHTVLLPLPVRRMVFSGVPRGGLAYAPSIPQEGQSAKAAIWRVQCIVNGVRWVDLLLLLLSEILR